LIDFLRCKLLRISFDFLALI